MTLHKLWAGLTRPEPEGIVTRPVTWDQIRDRNSDLRRMQRLGDALGRAIEDLDIDSIQLSNERPQERLGEIQDLLEQARLACWSLN